MREYFGFQKQIANTLEDATGIKNPDIEFASDEKFGDYSSNIALKDNSLNIDEIIEKINKEDLKFTAEKKGKFINFWIKKIY